MMVAPIIFVALTLIGFSPVVSLCGLMYDPCAGALLHMTTNTYSCHNETSKMSLIS